ncbi:hypothetical protein scyTo_0021328 [Scyliorhinus torazame]|uniref:Uncharacterized protein n=1 Tax=Scyliorhinus torazame TaxID=75743 RepID=A0A401Q6U1_SCYTO|nr:hypothetical protein [Scyliorhinus torazame]
MLSAAGTVTKLQKSGSRRRSQKRNKSLPGLNKKNPTGFGCQLEHQDTKQPEEKHDIQMLQITSADFAVAVKNN